MSESSYGEMINRLEAILTVEYAAMKTGVVKVNKSLLLSYIKVIDDLKRKQSEEIREELEEAKI